MVPFQFTSPRPGQYLPKRGDYTCYLPETHMVRSLEYITFLVDACRLPESLECTLGPYYLGKVRILSVLGYLVVEELH